MSTLKNTVRKSILTTVILAAGSALIGCDDGYGGYGADDYEGYGPIDDGVFQSAADDWSSYIRGDY